MTKEAIIAINRITTDPIIKQPYEEFVVEMNWSAYLHDGSTIINAEVLDTNCGVTLHSFSNTAVQLLIKSAGDEAPLIKITTSNNAVYHRRLAIKVRDN